MLITQAEIKRLKTNPRQLSWKDVERGYKPVEQIKINGKKYPSLLNIIEKAKIIQNSK